MHPESTAALDHIRAKFGAGKRLVFVSGNFNVLHPGHLRVLRFAADCGDALVVGVDNRPNAETVVPGKLRVEGIRSLSIVDYAFLLHDSPEAFIAALKPAVVVKGKEHEKAFNPERSVVESYGGQLLFSSGEFVFSSLDLLKREFNELTPAVIVKPKPFMQRHGFDLSGLKKLLRSFSGLRVLVVGDLIVDEYVACDALGMSQEDPTIVVTPILNERFVGGAGIVAGHACSIGAETKFLSVGGDDQTAEFAVGRLRDYGVETVLLHDSSRPTTLKQRYRAAGKTLLRVSHLKQHAIDHKLQDAILKEIKTEICKCDLLIFSDFNYGLLPQSLVDAIAAAAREHNVPMVADSQSSSQVGDVSRFRNMLLLKPTEREARLAMRDFDSGLVVLAEALRQRTDAKNIVVTLGKEGLLIHAASDRDQGWLTDQLPALNTVPRDVAGGGDSFLVLSSLAMVAGASIWESAYLGSLAAACQVSRIGNIPLTAAEIEMEIDV